MREMNSENINQQQSVSAIADLVCKEAEASEDKESSEVETKGLGVSLQSFDSLMAHLTSMNIKFLN